MCELQTTEVHKSQQSIGLCVIDSRKQTNNQTTSMGLGIVLLLSLCIGFLRLILSLQNAIAFYRTRTLLREGTYTLAASQTPCSWMDYNLSALRGSIVGSATQCW